MRYKNRQDLVRVLIVEDEAVLANQLVAAIEAAGYAVDSAADGRRAEFLVRPSTTTRSFSTSACPGSTA